VLFFLFFLFCRQPALSPKSLIFSCHQHTHTHTAWAIRAHTLFLAALVLSTAHVQVATRLLALGAPGWLWGAASVAAGSGGGGGGGGAGRKWLAPPRLLWGWALGYAAVGGVLHATWYPWT
jgi:hypothetical protein